MNSYLGTFPLTYFGYDPDVSKEEVKRRLLEFESGDNRITELSRAYRIELGTGWWITSALESNIGLNAIAQWTYRLNNPLPQGLGTGQLYLNNVSPEPDLRADKFFFRGEESWE